MNYEFHVGDYVETKDGEVGYIYKVCHCSLCEDRGFYEPSIRYVNGDVDYISFSQAENLSANFKRIGQYDFAKSEQPNGIKPLIKSWILDDGDDKGEYYFDAREVIRKINELVDAINELREECNRE